MGSGEWEGVGVGGSGGTGEFGGVENGASRGVGRVKEREE
jgi:hypothetical protein